MAIYTIYLIQNICNDILCAKKINRGFLEEKKISTLFSVSVADQ